MVIHPYIRVCLNGRMHNSPTTSNAIRISIILPVFRNLAITRACIESVCQSHLPERALLTVINDGSPEEDIVEYCLEASQRLGFNFINNQENVGFVKTANQGMSLDSGADVILLNSDTVVPRNWVERLQRCAYAEDATGTVTPFSNTGTICSYPVFPLSNPLPCGWSTQELDDVVQTANDGLQHNIPTAVGFCMYIKRSCIEATGVFDEENFGLGYGEECDFSLRSAAKGWKHVLAADLFVYHEGGASFSSESDDRKHRADAVMDKLHPQYDELITAFIQNDSLAYLRQNIDTARIQKRAGDLPVVFAEHARYQQSLLTRVTREKDNLEREKLQSEKLANLLSRSREEFQQTDSALTAAHLALEELGANFTTLQQDAQKLHSDVERLTSEIDTLSSELYISNDQRQELSDRLELIFNSRSWRYTRWLRRDEPT